MKASPRVRLTLSRFLTMTAIKAPIRMNKTNSPSSLGFKYLLDDIVCHRLSILNVYRTVIGRNFQGILPGDSHLQMIALHDIHNTRAHLHRCGEGCWFSDGPNFKRGRKFLFININIIAALADFRCPHSRSPLMETASAPAALSSFTKSSRAAQRGRRTGLDGNPMYCQHRWQ